MDSRAHPKKERLEARGTVRRGAVESLLKDLGVPARDVQVILGHARISTTLEIYTDTDEQARRDALTKLHDLFDQAQD